MPINTPIPQFPNGKMDWRICLRQIGLFKSLLSQISGASRNTIAFSADRADGNRLSGTMKGQHISHCLWGRQPRYLISNIGSYIDGNEIIFDKNYDGGGGYGHTVRYKI